MKKIVLPVIVMIAAITGCMKNEDATPPCTPNTLEKDRTEINSYIAANGLNVQYNSTLSIYSGISYSGSGSQPAFDSIVAFKRTLRTFKDGQTITVGTDSLYRDGTGNLFRYSAFQNDAVLKNFLDNAQLGGNLQIIYPSSGNPFFLGCQQQTLTNGIVIPAYSQLIVDYTLTGVKNSQ